MIVLRNEGEIDLDLIKTMGVNVKEAESAIGYFGTGLKYAIAVFLRENIDFKLFVGKHEYVFYTEPKTIRGKEFQICHMRGPYDSTPLGFTVELGKNWAIWQAYREIHSNCLDEDGEINRAKKACGKDGKTTFVIEDMDTHGIFLGDMGLNKIFSNHRIEIYKGESSHIYYRGVRAKDLPEKSKYTYNIVECCTLTEDRLLCYDFEVEHAINESVAKMENKEIVKDVITAKESYESRLSMEHNCYGSPSQEFLEVYNDNKAKVNSSVVSYVKNKSPKKPMTQKERAEKFREKLEDFCKSYEIDYEIDKDGYVTIMAASVLMSANESLI